MTRERLSTPSATPGITVEHLLAAIPVSDVAVVARDPQRAERFASRGVAVRQGDYADPASLRAAFEGADQLLLVSSSDPRADAVELHRNAIDAAVYVGVGRVLYTSHQGANPANPFPPARDHFATEALLEESGLTWTALRNGFYAHSLPLFLGPWAQTGVISVPSEGRVSWTAREDAGKAAARILLAGSQPDGAVTLTAPDAPTFGEIAELAEAVSGRPVEFRVVGDEAWLADQIAAGQDEFRARFALGLFSAAAAGFFAGTGPSLGEVLGRSPADVRAVLAG